MGWANVGSWGMLAWADDAAVRPWMVVLGVGGLLLLGCLWCIGLRYIPNNRVGVIEKMWSSRGSVPAGGILALRGEAGYQVKLLRGGLHFGLWPWQYKIHKVSLVTIPQGKIGYVYARDGEPLSASQTLGRDVESNNFQDAGLFLAGVNGTRGQRGRQRSSCARASTPSTWRCSSSSPRMPCTSWRCRAAARASGWATGRRSWPRSTGSTRWWSAAWSRRSTR